MWLLTLDMMEAATIVSSLATLAIAITSLYQVRREVRDASFPFLSVDEVAYVEDGRCELMIRNYGTGPALYLRFSTPMSSGNTSIPIFIQNAENSYIHIGVNETKPVILQVRELVNEANDNTATSVRISYECLRGKSFVTTATFRPRQITKRSGDPL